jgi:hypothetical protein
MGDPLFLGIRLDPAFSDDGSPGTKLPKGKEKSFGGLPDHFFDNCIDTSNTTENECKV